MCSTKFTVKMQTRIEFGLKQRQSFLIVFKTVKTVLSWRTGKQRVEKHSQFKAQTKSQE